MVPSSSQSLEHKGCRLSYKVQGSGAPVVFIQGVGVHGDGWGPQTDALSSLFTCLSFDNRGMGLSQPVGGPLSVAQMADDVRAIMDDAGWESAHMVGHSLGGLVALQFALNLPKRVRSLSLLCTFATGAEPTKLTPKMFWMGLRTFLGTRAMRRRAFLDFILSKEELRTANAHEVAISLAPIFGHDLADQAPIAMQQLKCMRGIDFTPRLRELNHIPTLVVSGEFDPIARPLAGAAIADGIQDSEYVELQGASHGLPISCAEEVNSLLLAQISTAEAIVSARAL